MRKIAVVHSGSPEATRELGYLIGQRAPAGTVLAVTGGLGAGKTVLAAGVAAGLGISEPVTSPTFIYFNKYEGGRLPFIHLDAYRLENDDEETKAQIGLDDCFRADQLTLAEWPRYVEEWLPRESIRIWISQSDPRPQLRAFRFDYDEREQWLDEIIGH